jgi:hypothetical protein
MNKALHSQLLREPDQNNVVIYLRAILSIISRNARVVQLCSQQFRLARAAPLWNHHCRSPKSETAIGTSHLVYHPVALS